MILNLVLLVVGFVLLIKGADIFVDGASSVATNFKVSKMLIGLTIVAFGTSAPEFAVSVKSLLSGNGDIVLGNVVGSNILNILLILGVASMVHTLKVKDNTVKKEIPITILFSLVFTVLLTDGLFDKGLVNTFSRSDGIVLILFFSIFIYYLFTIMKNKTDDDDSEKMSMFKSFMYVIIGICGIVFGSNFVVDSASGIASILGVSERMIGLTIVALGTSLPELVTSVVATKRGEYDIAIGNVVGSNIFNIGMVIGLPTAIFGGIGGVVINYVDLVMMILAALLLFLFSYKKHTLTKKAGITFLILFVIYYTYVILG